MENKTSPDTWVYQPCTGNAVLPTGPLFLHPIASPGPCWCVIFLSHQQIPSQVFSNKEFNFSHLKKKKKKISFHRFPTCTRRPTCQALPQLRACAHNAGLLCTPNPSDPGPSGYWRYHNSFFSQWQARKDDRTCVCSQKTGLNWFRGEKIELCVFFFSLTFSQRPGSI